ncbi:MAG: hypothetical protein AB7E70_19505 [Hyphomicrobiaceae bacterium]
MSRLTDQELEEAFDYAHGSLRMTAALSELRERRAADLTAQDVEALSYFVETSGVTHIDGRETPYGAAHRVVRKLLAREVGR